MTLDEEHKMVDNEVPQEAAPEHSQILAVGPSPRIPPFWKTDAALWFIQLEAIFSTSRITTSTSKYQLAVAHLELPQLQQVADILKNPGPTPYESLKTRLLSTYEESENSKLTKLLEQTTIGDEKPSHFLRSMRQKAGTLITDGLLRNLWLRALPRRMQEILTTVEGTDLDKLAAMADKIAEVEPSPVFQVEKTSQENSPIAELTRQVTELTKRLDHLSRRSQSPARNSSRTQPNSLQREPTADQRSERLCWYHQKFGDRATKCQPPCARTSKN